MAPLDNDNLNREAESLFQGSTFFPDEDPRTADVLHDMVTRNRFSAFLALYGEFARIVPPSGAHRAFFTAALEIITCPPAERALVINNPIFQIWVGVAFRAANALLTRTDTDPGPFGAHLDTFPEMLRRLSWINMESSFDPTRSICRFDVDPLIAGATPPSYDFPTDESAQKRLESTTYSVSFFSEVVMLALSRLQSTWPQCHREFGRLVKLICHLPDASFRSCSASRYVGIVLLSCKDNSILDLEESLVHEWGHQLLYNIVEVCPVVCAPEDDALYTLPWSGQKRDLYGYFHAYFIYVLLAKYLDRVRGRPPAEERQAKKRMAFILRGLLKALPDFLESKHVTPQGSLLLANIAREVNALAERHRTLLIEVAA